MRPSLSEPPSAEALQALFARMRTVGHAFKARFQGTLAAHDLTFPQWLVLVNVESGKQTVSDLAQVCEVTPANITGIVDRLERDGLVTRARSEQDRRVVFVALTPGGRRRYAAVRAAGTETILREAFHGWSADEIAQLHAMLERVH